MSSGYSIFISYAHEDEAFKNALTQQLKGLKRQGIIAPWDDRCIDGGDEWRENIRTAIDGCQLALLLVSPAFIASDFIYTEELNRLLERRGHEGIRVVPIILRPCAWKHEKPIESLQARPKDGKAIVTFPTEDGARDQAWSEIVDEIARWAQEHRGKAASTGAPQGALAGAASKGKEILPDAPPSPAEAGSKLARDLIYISYRHRDREWHDRLRKILDADPRLSTLVWDDTKIPGGADWQREIDAHVPRARIMVMLASDDYFDPVESGAFAPEVTPALAAHASGELAILWFPVRPLSIADSPVRHITAATGAGTVALELLTPEDQAECLIRVYQAVLHAFGMPTEPVSPTIRSAAHAPMPRIPDVHSAAATSHTGGASMTNTSTIIFLAASPEGEAKLALDKEAREIEEKIQQADHRDSLVFETKWAVRPDDLLRHLDKLKPQVVHFSGHGTSTSELILNDDNGQPKPVSARAIRALFELHKRTVRLVVLNACYSKKQAKAIVEVIDCAVGMRKEIGDDAAVVFAAAFYRKLGFGASIKEAFEEGRVALMLQGIPEETTPELLVRDGVDPTNVFLAGPYANPR